MAVTRGCSRSIFNNSCFFLSPVSNCKVMFLSLSLSLSTLVLKHYRNGTGVSLSYLFCRESRQSISMGFSFFFFFFSFFNTEHSRRGRAAQFIRVECKKRESGWKFRCKIMRLTWIAKSRVRAPAFCFMSFTKCRRSRRVSATPRGLIFYFLTVTLARSSEWKISNDEFQHSRCTISDTDRTIAIFGNILSIFGRSFQAAKLQFPYPLQFFFRNTGLLSVTHGWMRIVHVQVCLYFVRH